MEFGGLMRGKFDEVAFYAAINRQRESKRLTWKQVAEQSGVSASTLTRMGQGKRPDVGGLAALLAWSGLKADDFIRTDKEVSAEPLAQIVAYLRANANLSTSSADAMEAIIKAAYEQFKTK
jgi:transcriptional regulator with XRE-family HTH domain